MSGGGIGSALGSGLGLLLAPETGGLSMLIPAIGGAAGGALGAGLTHGNPLTSALMGGIGGGLTGGLTGGLGIGNLFGSSLPEGATDLGSAMPWLGSGSQIGGALGAGSTDLGNAMPWLEAGSNAGIASDDPFFNAVGDSAFGSPDTANIGSDSSAAAASSGANTAAKGAVSDADKILGYLKGKDKLAALSLAGNSLFAGADQLLNPPSKYNLAGNTAAVKNTAGFSNTLPQYTMQNTASPYAGNWYTYGQTPQAPMYNAMPVPVPQQARGGLVGYAQGGTVMPNIGGAAPGAMSAAGTNPIAPQEMYNLLSTLQTMSNKPQMAPQNPLQPQNQPPQVAPMIKPAQFARGGQVRGYAMGGLPQPAMTAPTGQQPNPLAAIQTAHKAGMIIGHALASHLKRGAHTPDGRVQGPGTGQSDSVPAKLSKDEYIVPADVVGHLGDGSSDAGGKALDHLVSHVRKQKAVKGFPPKAKNPLAYLPKGAA